MPRPDFSSKKDKIEKFIRVNQAGEYGAKRIYEGQIRFTKNMSDKDELNIMLSQEQVHLEYFNKQLNIRKIRPTIFMPFWHLGGYTLGAVSAAFGIKTAMLITDAVEDVIEEHYNQQINYLKYSNFENDLMIQLQKFRQDEIEHKNIAAEHIGNGLTTMLVTQIVKAICKSAIAISKSL
ncbi:MAG: demethoxyubiquinone hydroxylase family protein [Janthinobacterium lividum]